MCVISALAEYKYGYYISYIRNKIVDIMVLLFLHIQLFQLSSFSVIVLSSFTRTRQA